MLKIRLRRAGKKSKPSYRIVVAEHTSPIQGKFIDRLGAYDPQTKNLTLDKESILRWINQGAQPSNTVAKLMAKAKITHKNVSVKVASKKAPKKEPKEPKAASTDTAIPEAQTETADQTIEQPAETTPSESNNTSKP